MLYLGNLDKYTTNIINYLPSYYRDRINVKKLMEITDRELGELNYYAITLGGQATVKKATWGVRTWEKEMGIVYNPSMPLEDRREVVIAKIRGRGTTTKKMIKNIAEAFSGSEVEVIEFPEEHYFVIKFVGTRGVPKNMQGFIDMLNLIKPSHLEYLFEYTYLTWDNFDNYNKTWDEWDALNLTWDEFEIYNEVI